MRVALETGVPCGFGLLTVDSMAQARERVSGGSKRDTGRHAVEAVLASLEAKDTLTGRQPDDSRAARLSEAGRRAGG
jgi:6,7-dimethyl-8-ribityllumazine synthase